MHILGEKFQTHGIIIHHKKLERVKETKGGGRKEVINFRVETNKLKSKNNRENKWNQKLALWEDQKNWYMSGQKYQENKEKNHNQH